MQSIKAVVIGLGIVILLGTGALVGVVIERMAAASRDPAGSASSASLRADSPQAPAPAAPVAGGFGQLALDRPAGSEVRSVTAVGTLLVLHLGAERGSGEPPGNKLPGNELPGDELVVIDPARGAVLGTIRLKRAP